MAQEELRRFLQAERSRGELIGGGSFSIDFEQAMAKRASFALPHPGLWAVRSLQGLIRLGATGISFQQGRKAMVITAPLAAELPPEQSVADIFCVQDAADQRWPLQAGLLAALGRDYALEVHWSSQGQRMAMLLAEGGSLIEPRSTPMPLPVIEIYARPASRAGLLSRIFQVADFSAEFREISRRAFLAPVPVSIDQRPCDFRTGFALHFYPDVEFRGVRATSGPRLPLLPSAARALARPGLAANEYYQPLDSGDYAFLLCVGWSSKRPRRSTVGWVSDGALVDEEPLFEGLSPLHLTLFLPANGLPTDASGMVLRQSSLRATRLREARLWAITSLKTQAPPASATDSSDLHEAIEERFEQAWSDHDFTRPEERQVPDAIETHLAEQERLRNARPPHPAWTSDPGREQQMRDYQSLARWGRFLSYTPPVEHQVYAQVQSRAHLEKQAKKFFGDFYVQLPAGPHPTETDRSDG